MKQAVVVSYSQMMRVTKKNPTVLHIKQAVEYEKDEVRSGRDCAFIVEEDSENICREKKNGSRMQEEHFHGGS